MHIAPRDGGVGTIRKIVIHLNVGPEVENGAQSLVNYLQGVDAGYHEVVDDRTSVIAAQPDQVVYGASGMYEAGYHLCVIAEIQTAAQWHDPYSTNELAIAAMRVAYLCHQFDLPPVLLTDAQIADPNARGVCDHWGVNRAIVLPANARGDHSMGPGDHTDVGAEFPWVEFMGKVAAVYAGGAPKPAPAPKPKVTPMYDPPLGPIAAVWLDTDPGTPASLAAKPGEKSKVLAAVSPFGDVYAWGVPYRQWPSKAHDFAGRQAAQIGQAPHLPDGRYQITTTMLETYAP